MSERIREATIADAAAIAAIYAPYCTETGITFETVAPTVEEMAGRIATVTSKYPWLLAERDGNDVGYAYAGPMHERAAYRWSAIVSVYVADGYQRQGAGRRLYEQLFERMREQNLLQAVALITLPNDASIALHESLGFVAAGKLTQIGYKLNQWRDVGYWQLRLKPLVEDPPEPVWGNDQ